MEGNLLPWVFYLAGAIFTLGFKLGRYLYGGRKHKKSIGKCLLDWFFEKSAENAVSWVTTIGLVWVFGVIYISRVGFAWAPFLESIPVHNSFAFLLGSIMEIAAPNAAKFLVSKLPGGKK